MSMSTPEPLCFWRREDAADYMPRLKRFLHTVNARPFFGHPAQSIMLIEMQGYRHFEWVPCGRSSAQIMAGDEADVIYRFLPLPDCLDGNFALFRLEDKTVATGPIYPVTHFDDLGLTEADRLTERNET